MRVTVMWWTPLLLGWSAGWAAAQPADGAGLRDAVLARWQALAAEVESFESTRYQEFWRSQPGKPLESVRKDVLRYAFAPDRSLSGYEITEPAPSGQPVVSVQLEIVNPRYKAVLSRREGTGDWLLTRFEPNGQPDLTGRGAVLLPWTVCGNVPMADWLKDPRVTGLRVERPSAGVVRLHFAFDERRAAPPGDRAADPGIRSGYIDFDETGPYRVLGYQFKRATKFSDWVEVGTLEYATQQGPFPVLKRHTLDSPDVRSAKFGPRSSREVATYEASYNREIPDDRFWLSHYGLPEPAGVVREKPVAWYVWPLAVAGVLVVLAVLFRWLARRRRAAQATA